MFFRYAFLALSLFCFFIVPLIPLTAEDVLDCYEECGEDWSENSDECILNRQDCEAYCEENSSDQCNDSCDDSCLDAEDGCHDRNNQNEDECRDACDYITSGSPDSDVT